MNVTKGQWYACKYQGKNGDLVLGVVKSVRSSGEVLIMNPFTSTLVVKRIDVLLERNKRISKERANKIIALDKKLRESMVPAGRCYTEVRTAACETPEYAGKFERKPEPFNANKKGQLELPFDGKEQKKPVVHRYVCFDDSSSDPTYAGATSTVLVMSSASDGVYNPCVDASAKMTPLIPTNPVELQEFAEFFGWQVKEIDGVLHIKTGVKP